MQVSTMGMRPLFPSLQPSQSALQPYGVGTEPVSKCMKPTGSCRQDHSVISHGIFSYPPRARTPFRVSFERQQPPVPCWDWGSQTNHSPSCLRAPSSSSTFASESIPVKIRERDTVATLNIPGDFLVGGVWNGETEAEISRGSVMQMCPSTSYPL